MASQNINLAIIYSFIYLLFTFIQAQITENSASLAFV